MLIQVKKLTAERESLSAAANQLADTAANENRDLTDTEQASLTSWAERCATIDGQLTLLGTQMDSQRAYASLRSRLDYTEPDPPPPSRVRPDQVLSAGMQTRDGSGLECRSWGEHFVESEEFRKYRGRGSSEAITLPGMFDRAASDPIMVSTFPGGLPPYYFTPTPWQMTTPLLNALGRVTVSSNSIEWYTWPGAYPVAAVVAEGDAKPPADFTPTPHTQSLQTYAHWKALSRQALEDIPQIQSIVTNALQGGILTALETAAATALGAAGSGIPSITNTDLLAGIRIAIGDVQSRGFANPNAVLLNPQDFAALDMSIMAATVAGPVRAQNVWGIPAIAVGAIPAGTAYVGDFSTAVTLFARNQVEAYMSDSHQDFFIKNLLVILAEQRALVAVTEPAAAEQVVVGTTMVESGSAPSGQAAPASSGR
jgi:hypothetical protein